MIQLPEKKSLLDNGFGIKATESAAKPAFPTTHPE
jgi:hypothetical protein